MSKLKSHFKAKLMNESLGFIKTLDNLVTQHVRKINRKSSKVVSEKETHDYFIFIRNLLSKEKLVKGISYDMWINQNINTVPEMNDSTKLYVDIDKIDEYINNNVEGNSRKSSKIFTLKDSVKIYG
mmetsp:Transcript_10944/g.9673  ORF Transcript_10944/g.9673 Transcript_10944/m.9673 type:complete len:126 (+) Transcript_10944:810-1187(+)